MGQYLQIVEVGPNSILTYYDDAIRGPVARKTATQSGLSDVIDQINFLKSLPLNIRTHFPTLLDFDNQNNSWYEMPYYSEHDSLHDRFLRGDDADENLCGEFVAVLDFVYNIFHNLQTAQPWEDTNLNLYLYRPIERLQSLPRLDPTFEHMLHVSEICVDNVPIIPAYQLLRQQKTNATIARLDPPKRLVMAHGQLGFSHILMHKNYTSPFTLLDFAGHKFNDYAYDCGKLLQCIDSAFDMLVNKGHVSELYFDRKVIRLGNRSITPEQTAFLNVMKKELITFLKVQHGNKFENEYARALLASASHMCGSVEFCYKIGNLERALECYALASLAYARFLDFVC